MFDSFENSILENEEISKLKKFLDNSMKGSNNNSYEELAKEIKTKPQDKKLGFNDPNVIEARKKLSSMMFK